MRWRVLGGEIEKAGRRNCAGAVNMLSLREWLSLLYTAFPLTLVSLLYYTHRKSSPYLGKDLMFPRTFS